MKLGGLEKVVQREKEIEITDFKSVTAEMKNVRVYKNKIADGYRFARVFDNSMAKKVTVLPKAVIVETDNKITLLNNYVSLMSFDKKVNSNVTFVEIEYQGVMGALTFEGNGSSRFLSYGGLEITLETTGGEHAIVLGNKVFSAGGNTLYFYTFDQLDKSQTSNYITLPQDLGCVTGLVAHEKKLLVFCQHGIMQLTAFGNIEDYFFERLTLPVLEIEGLSVIKIGYKTAFINNGELFTYDGKTVKKVQTALDFSKYKVSGKSALWNQQAYAIKVTEKNSGNTFVYVYDFEDDSESLIPSGECEIANGNHLLINGALYFGDSDYEYLGGEAKWKSSRVGYLDGQKKALSNISVTTSSTVTIKLEGEFGAKEISTGVGINKKRLNLLSNTLSLTATSEDEIGIEKIKMKFRIRGE